MIPLYFDQESRGSIAGYFLASDLSLERPWKAPTTLSVACVTGSSKLPPAGDTVPPIVTVPIEPSLSLTLPALS